MVFSNIIGRSGERRRSSRSAKSARNNGRQVSVGGASSSTSSLPLETPGIHRAPEYIADEAHLAPVEQDPPDLRELNACLDALAIVFPDVQIEVFREMLSSFAGESKLFIVADALLKNGVSWVKGRWKVPDSKGALVAARTRVKEKEVELGQKEGKHRRGIGAEEGEGEEGEEVVVPRAEAFRNPEYKKAVRSLAWQEFKGLSRSTINAVLAENNYDYLPSRRELVRLSQKSWRFTISTLFLRRRTPADEAKDTEALVNWRPTGQGSIEPTLKTTGNPELDQELFQVIIEPLKVEERDKQLAKDKELAVKLNGDEAEKANALFECACCYADVTFEELCSCSGEETHNICFRCVQHCVSEAVFGQGWRSIDEQRGTLNCPAVDATECNGVVPQDQLFRAVTSQKEGASIVRRLDHRLADMSLVASGLPLVRCPFCDYAEIDNIYLPSAQSTLRINPQCITVLLVFIAIGFAITPSWIPVVALFLLFILCNIAIPVPAAVSLASPLHPQAQEQPKPTLFPSYIALELRASITRHLRRQRGLRFVCLSPICGRPSCLSCLKPWTDIHVCNESALIELRTKVEQAMSLAIKRVCPRCNTSFVKSSGCNKLTCPCGYKMCYVCRKDIGGGGDGDGGGEGYRHFCDHFRPEGDGSRCQLCDRCNLWEAEDTDTVLKKAKEKAEVEWREREGRKLSGNERRFLETSVPGPEGGLFDWFSGRDLLAVADICDWVVEKVLV